MSKPLIWCLSSGNLCDQLIWSHERAENWPHLYKKILLQKVDLRISIYKMASMALCTENSRESHTADFKVLLLTSLPIWMNELMWMNFSPNALIHWTFIMYIFTSRLRNGLTEASVVVVVLVGTFYSQILLVDLSHPNHLTLSIPTTSTTLITSTTLTAPTE